MIGHILMVQTFKKKTILEVGEAFIRTWAQKAMIGLQNFCHKIFLILLEMFFWRWVHISLAYGQK